MSSEYYIIICENKKKLLDICKNNCDRNKQLIDYRSVCWYENEGLVDYKLMYNKKTNKSSALIRKKDLDLKRIDKMIGEYSFYLTIDYLKKENINIVGGLKFPDEFLLTEEIILNVKDEWYFAGAFFQDNDM